MGVNGVLDSSNSFFLESFHFHTQYSSRYRFQKPLSLIGMDPKQDLYFNFSRAGLSCSFFFFGLCPYFPCGRLLFVDVRSSETGVLPRVFGAWDLWLTWCFCLGLFKLSCGLSWLMMTGPQVAVLLFDMMACLFRPKDLFTRCRPGIQADSSTQAKLHCAVAP